MNYQALTLEELGRLAITDAGARAYVADHAEEIINQATDFAQDPDFCDDELQAEGANQLRDKLKDLYSEQLLEWIGQVDNMALAGDGNLDELETLLGAIHAEFEDEDED